ncbi:MAG: nucleotidyltransferase domain-containing protein [Dehalococcoidia bacterium]
MAARNALALAERLAERLGRIDGIVAVALGGSLARGEGRPDSDIDLGIYFRGANRPERSALRALAQELDDRHFSLGVRVFSGDRP